MNFENELIKPFWYKSAHAFEYNEIYVNCVTELRVHCALRRVWEARICYYVNLLLCYTHTHPQYMMEMRCNINPHTHTHTHNHTLNTQLQCTLQTPFLMQHSLFVKDVWKSKILCDAFATHYFLFLFLLLFLSHNSERIVSNSSHLNSFIAIAIAVATATAPEIHPIFKKYMHISHHAVISLWLLDIALHFRSMFYYFIFFSLFFPFFSFRSLIHILFFFFRFTLCGVLCFACECHAKSSLEYGVKMHKQIKLCEIFITSNCIEWSGVFWFNLYPSVVLARSFFCSHCDFESTGLAKSNVKHAYMYRMGKASARERESARTSHCSIPHFN